MRTRSSRLRPITTLSETDFSSLLQLSMKTQPQPSRCGAGKTVSNLVHCLGVQPHCIYRWQWEEILCQAHLAAHLRVVSGVWVRFFSATHDAYNC